LTCSKFIKGTTIVASETKGEIHISSVWSKNTNFSQVGTKIRWVGASEMAKEGEKISSLATSEGGR